MRRTLLPLAALLVIAVSLQRPSRGDEPAEKEDPFTKAAEARQAAIKTLDVAFRLTEVVSKGGVSGRQPGGRSGEKGARPDKETTLKSVNRLVVDGGKLRLEMNHPIRFASGLDRFRSLTTYEKRVGRLYYPEGIEMDGKPSGLIDREVHLSIMHATRLLPLTMTFRGLDDNFVAHPVPALTRTGATRSIGGSECPEYAFLENKQPLLTVWVDPAKDYNVVRIRRSGREASGATELLDVQYRKDERHGWLPVSWVQTDTAQQGGKVLSTTKAEVVKMKVNEPVSAEEFTIAFPEDAQVQDRTHRAPQGPAKAKPWYQEPVWIGAGVAVVLLIALVLVVLRKRATPGV
jgi:hypothetical protein